MPQNRYKNKYHSTIVCIDSYDDKIFNGRLYNEFLESEVYFKSTIEFILSMSDILNRMDYPKPFLEARIFAQTESITLSEKKFQEMREGTVATFTVRIVFCQNSSWQGSVSWFENGQEKRFRSVLELLLIFDSALQQSHG